MKKGLRETDAEENEQEEEEGELKSLIFRFPTTFGLTHMMRVPKVVEVSMIRVREWNCRTRDRSRIY